MPYLNLTFTVILFLGIASLPAQGLMVAATGVALADYSAAAAGLFNNMRTPAALIGGALVGLGILSAPTINKDDSKAIKLLKKANIIIAVASLLSEIMAVIYSSIAINKIAEITQPKTAGVAQLIAQKHELAWLGTNIHFLFGMMGFALIVGSKSYFNMGPEMGKITIAWGIASFFQSLAIVNRGISQGSVVEDVSSQFASNFFTLIIKYISCAIKASKGGICGYAAITAGAYAMYHTTKTMIGDLLSKEDTPAP